MPTLPEAIAAIKAGRRDEARVMLTQILSLDQRNITALLWMTEVSSTTDERRKYLKRILEIDPNNAMARKGLELLGDDNEQPSWMQQPKLQDDKSAELAKKLADEQGVVIAIEAKYPEALRSYNNSRTTTFFFMIVTIIGLIFILTMSVFSSLYSCGGLMTIGGFIFFVLSMIERGMKHARVQQLEKYLADTKSEVVRLQTLLQVQPLPRDRA